MYKKEILTYGLATILALIVVAVAVFAFDFGQYGDLGEVPDDFLSQSCGVENGRYYYCKQIPFLLNSQWINYLSDNENIRNIILVESLNVTDIEIWMDDKESFEDALKDIESYETLVRINRAAGLDVIEGTTASFNIVIAQQYLSNSPHVIMPSDPSEKTLLCLRTNNGQIGSISLASTALGGLVVNNAGDRQTCADYLGEISNNNNCVNNPNLPYCN